MKTDKKTDMKTDIFEMPNNLINISTDGNYEKSNFNVDFETNFNMKLLIFAVVFAANDENFLFIKSKWKN